MAIKFTQRVLLQSYEDEFKCKAGKLMIPAGAGGVLVKKHDREEVLSKGEQTKYQSGVRKLRSMMQWSIPEIYNVVRDLSRYMTTCTTQKHIEMDKVMNYCLSTRERGLLLKLDEAWDGNPEFNLRILGRSDSDCTKDMETRKNVSGTSTFCAELLSFSKAHAEDCHIISNRNQAHC